MTQAEEALVADVRSRLFRTASASGARTIGAELELIPLLRGSHAPVPVADERGPSLSACVKEAALIGGWVEIPSPHDVPSWKTGDGSRLSFEPGGQIEISSAACDSCSAVISSIQTTAVLLQTASSSRGIDLLAVGVDPYNDISRVRLQLTAERYALMTRYFEARGGSGVRMMRQTAALQVNVEQGPAPFARWGLLNALAPYLVALFASSSRYAGKATGHSSYRAHLWRTLDPSRTGIPYDSADPALRYAEFALDAGYIRSAGNDDAFHSFRSLVQGGGIDEADWIFHLSTLFPEVRPKQYFELRSADTIDPAHLAAPLTFVTGIVYDDVASRATTDLLGGPEPSLLISAGREGLSDPRIREVAAELVEIALAGAHRLGSDYLCSEDLAIATEWLRSRVSSSSPRDA